MCRCPLLMWCVIVFRHTNPDVDENVRCLLFVSEQSRPAGWTVRATTVTCIDRTQLSLLRSIGAAGQHALHCDRRGASAPNAVQLGKPSKGSWRLNLLPLIFAVKYRSILHRITADSGLSPSGMKGECFCATSGQWKAQPNPFHVNVESNYFTAEAVSNFHFYKKKNDCQRQEYA